MILILFASFFSISLLVFCLLNLYYKRFHSSEHQITKRVKDYSKKTQKEKISLLPFITRNDQLSQIPLLNRLLGKLDISNTIQNLLTQAGSKMSVGELVLRVVILMVVGFFISLFFKNIFLKIGCCFLLGSFPLLHVIIQRANRIKLFIKAFPDSLDMMTSAIRAGHALNQAMQLVGEEAPDPVGIEFKKTFEQYNLGLNLREALIKMTERVGSLDLKLFVTAILLQRETGGNLTEVLEKISYTIRERFKLIGQIKTYTAQGRMSAWILGLLPITFVLIISALNPGYLIPLFQDKLGHYLILIATVLQVIGFSIIRKIIQIKYQ